MAAKELKRATDNLACPVCYQVFKNPKYLSCYHSYCEKCLVGMQCHSATAPARITCPECRKDTVVPPEGVKELPNNFFINRLVDEFILKRKVEGEEDVKCDNCDEDDFIVSYCPDCSFFLCQVCNEAHKRGKRSRGHGIVPLTELRSNKDVSLVAKVKVPMCKEHDYELKHYCETCEELVCLYCTTKEHSDHSHNTVKKMADKHRNELQKITSPVEEMIKGLSDAHRNIDNVKKKVRQQGDEVDKKIDEHYNALIQKLTKQKEQLKQQAHDAVLQKEKALTMQLKEVENMQSEVLSMKELKDAIENGSDQEALSAKKQVIVRMQQVTDKYKKLNVQPSQSATMEFISTEESLPQLGKVLTDVDAGTFEVKSFPNHITVGKELKFSIITKYRNASQCSIGGSEVSVHVKSSTGEVTHAQVEDNNDGSYTISFTPRQAGKMKLFVSINGQQTSGSPYNLVQYVDYATVGRSSVVVNNDDDMDLPWGIGFSKNGSMWAVADYSKPCVYIYDDQNQLIHSFGSKEQFKIPAGIAFDENNCIYVTDRGSINVKKFDIKGTYLLQLESKKAELCDPVGITAHKNKIYVADYKCDCVFVFQNTSQFLHAIGKGRIRGPYDVAVSCNSSLLVASWTNGCIYRFTLDGNYIDKFGETGSGSDLLCNPSSLTVDANGFILVAEFSYNRVSVFDKTGKFVHCFGSIGCNNGQFQHPLGIALAPDGNIIYVSDTDNNRIQIFSI